MRKLLLAWALLAPVAAAAQPASGLPAAHGLFDTQVSADAAGQGGADFRRIVPATPYSYQAAATANDTNVKASPVTVFSVVACNQAASMRFVRLFDLAAAPTGVETPAFRGSLAASSGCVTLMSSAEGMTFANGLSFDITTTNGDSDQTAVTAGDVSLNITYR